MWANAGWQWMHDGGWWGIGMIGMALFWGVVLVLLAWAVRALVLRAGGPAGAGGTSGVGRETPLEILQRRYARGEIERDEYEQKRRDLSS